MNYEVEWGGGWRLDMLEADEMVRVATQHQALNAVVRFHEEVLGRKVEGAEGYRGARNTDCLCRRLPASKPLRAAWRVAVSASPLSLVSEIVTCEESGWPLPVPRGPAPTA